MDDMKDTIELNEQELAQVEGAGRGSLPVSNVCPNCKSGKYTAGSERNVRECSVCGTKYEYKRPYIGAKDPGI